MSPSIRSFGRSPATTWRSEASCVTISSRRLRKLIVPCCEGGTGALPPSERSIVDPVIVCPPLVVRSRACLANHLVDRGQALHYLEPAVHAEREHPLGNGGSLNFRNRRALHDEAAQLRRHVHHFIKSLSAFQSAALALLASLAAKDWKIADARVEGHLRDCRLSGGHGARLGVGEGDLA